ncbi:MAG: hypothetical protein R2864_00340 [Syntrophotaleaceae bacterium]
MACLLDRFLNRTEFQSYDDFCDNLSINIPQEFSILRSVVDVYAAEQPAAKRALVWCDDHGNEQTFAELKHYSNKAANLFQDYGIKRTDRLDAGRKGRYEFWFCLLGLHKLGIATPAAYADRQGYRLPGRGRLDSDDCRCR